MSKSKVVLITGASSGIGRATAESLTERGHQVFGTTRNTARSDLADGFEILSLDLRDEGAAEALVQGIVRRAGRVDVLINNAGYALFGAVDDFTHTRFATHTLRTKRRIDDYVESEDKAMGALDENLEKAAGPAAVVEQIVRAIERSHRMRWPAGGRARLLRNLRRFMPHAPADSSIRRVFGLA